MLCLRWPGCLWRNWCCRCVVDGVEGRGVRVCVVQPHAVCWCVFRLTVGARKQLGVARDPTSGPNHQTAPTNCCGGGSSRLLIYSLLLLLLLLLQIHLLGLGPARSFLRCLIQPPPDKAVEAALTGLWGRGGTISCSACVGLVELAHSQPMEP